MMPQSFKTYLALIGVNLIYACTSIFTIMALKRFAFQKESVFVIL